MNIEFLANHGPMGGGEVMLLQLAVAARELGEQVTVVGPANSEVESGSAALDLNFRGVAGGSRPQLMGQYAKYAQRTSADLLWCNGPVPALAVSFAAVPLFVHLHQVPSRQQGRLLSIVRRRAIVTLVPSDYMARVVPGSRSFANWTDAASQAFSHARALPTSGSPLRIGFIGRMSTAKGLDVLADAIGMLPETTNATLVIAGDDRFVPSSDSASVGLALEKIRTRVTFAGWIDRNEFHSRVDLVVVPSVWDEPFGLVAAESLARHTPLLVTDAGALPEIVGIEYPWIVPRNDASSIKTRILQMVDQPAETKSAIETGYARWLTHYSPQAGTARMRQLLTCLPQTR